MSILLYANSWWPDTSWRDLLITGASLLLPCSILQYARLERDMVWIATAKDSAEALNMEWCAVLQFYMIIWLPLSTKGKNSLWKHFFPCSLSSQNKTRTALCQDKAYSEQASKGNLWKEVGGRGKNGTSLEGCKGEIWTVIKLKHAAYFCCSSKLCSTSPAHGGFKTQVLSGMKGWPVF